MEREISGGVMLGIVLLALSAVIGLGFGVFSITKGVANEGTVNVQDTLNTVSTQVFQDYDQKIVTGTQAISALKSFEGKPYAILIATKAIQSGSPTSTNHISYAVQDAATKPRFLNYNAVIADISGGADWTTGKVASNTPTTDANAKDLLDFVNGSYEIRHGFASSNGVIVFDRYQAGIFKSGNSEYVPTSAKYQANLIKDLSGTIVGITFEQI